MIPRLARPPTRALRGLHAPAIAVGTDTDDRRALDPHAIQVVGQPHGMSTLCGVVMSDSRARSHRADDRRGTGRRCARNSPRHPPAHGRPYPHRAPPPTPPASHPRRSASRTRWPPRPTRSPRAFPLTSLTWPWPRSCSRSSTPTLRPRPPRPGEPQGHQEGRRLPRPQRSAQCRARPPATTDPLPPPRTAPC